MVYFVYMQKLEEGHSIIKLLSSFDFLSLRPAGEKVKSVGVAKGVDAGCWARCPLVRWSGMWYGVWALDTSCYVG